MLDGDLVAEEPRRASAGVGDQGFIQSQFQLEIITQESGQASLDLFGLGLGPGESEQGVVRVADIAQPPVARIIGIRAGQRAEPLPRSSRNPA